jgi:hypothetical protein
MTDDRRQMADIFEVGRGKAEFGMIKNRAEDRG